MSKNIKILSIFACIITSFGSTAQELPKVVPPSPEAASLFKYLDYPVNYSTGIPSINVPLYEVVSGSINVPISISYHSSGRKVTDETGAVGLGWTLLAGGMISRTIYGEADDNDSYIKFPSPWKKQADINTSVRAGADFLDGIYENHYPIPYYDTEYDIFSYSVNSLSGKFVLRDENNVKTPVLIPKKPYKIGFHKVSSSNISFFDYLTLTDDVGNIYTFGASESSSGSVGRSSWLLTEIISADKVDTVFFTYQGFVKGKINVSQSCTIIDQQFDCEARNIGSNPAKTDDGLGTLTETTYWIQRLVEIKFKSGSVHFGLEGGTSDLVKTIEIRNLKNEIIRRIEFDQSTQDAITDGNSATKKLNSVTIKDSNNNASETYQFEYYPSIGAPINPRFRDLWGYYNASGNLLMRPPVPVVVIREPFFANENYIAGDENSNRVPNLEATKSGVLKKITFPTGGSREFIYEQNRYAVPGSSQSQACGGLRLSQAITFDGVANTLIKTYKYGKSESGYGTLPLIPDVSNMSYETKHERFIVSGFTEDNGRGCSSTCTGEFFRKRFFSADVLPMFSEFHQKPVFYEQVTEYIGSLSENIGKTVYTYDKGNEFGYPNSVQNIFSNSDPKHWKTSSLIEKTDYERVNTSYVKTRKTTNGYLETVYPDEKLWGLHVGKYYFITPDYWIDPVSGESIPAYCTMNLPNTCSGASVPEVFLFSDYTLSVGKKELAGTIDSVFFDNGQTLVTTTDYLYNTDHLLRSTSTRDSKGDTLVTEIKYTSDFSGETISQEMASRNMLNVELEKSSFKNSILLTSTKTAYRNWGNNYIKPEIISTKQGNQPYDARVIFHSYDADGNVQSVSKDNGPRVTYLYGYNGDLPIAKVSNALPAQIYHTSFEDSDGNSGLNDARTGRKSRTNGFSKTLFSIPNGTYTLVYFKKISGVWALIMDENVSVANGTYNLSLTGQVDEIRFYPTGSTMSTFTFDPLEGVTSTTDENGTTTYYAYDRFQRLIKIKDFDLNTVKQIDYHYKE